MLLAVGRGPARAATCKHTLRHVHLRYDPQTVATTAVLLRALSLCRRGELRELRVDETQW
jgi:hypothetical protein